MNKYFEFEFYADVHKRDYESESLSNTVHKQILLVTTKAKWKLITGHIWEFNCQFSFFSSQSFWTRMQSNPAAALFILFLPLLGECLSKTEEAPYTVILSSVDMFHIFVFTIGIIDWDRWWLTMVPGKKEIILPPGETNCDGGKSHWNVFSWNNSELVNESISCRWVSTDAHDIVVHEGTEWRAAFFRLFNYIDGTNSENSKIPMTKPVSVRYLVERGLQMKLRQQSFWWTSESQPDYILDRILPGEGPNCGSNFTMSFLVPHELQVKSAINWWGQKYLEY